MMTDSPSTPLELPQKKINIFSFPSGDLDPFTMRYKAVASALHCGISEDWMKLQFRYCQLNQTVFRIKNLLIIEPSNIN